MSYTPTNWTSGDIITTEKLNKIEQGITTANNSNGGGGALIVTFSDDCFQISYNEIIQAISDGKIIVGIEDGVGQKTLFYLGGISATLEEYQSSWFSSEDTKSCTASDADGYFYYNNGVS